MMHRPPVLDLMPLRRRHEIRTGWNEAEGRLGLWLRGQLVRRPIDIHRLVASRWRRPLRSRQPELDESAMPLVDRFIRERPAVADSARAVA